MIKEPLFSQLSAEKQNICLWACLLHDIGIRGRPFIVGKDHIHAFRSAQTTLDVFKRLGFIYEGSFDDVQTPFLAHVDRLLTESVQPLPAIWREDFRHGVPVVTLMDSHHNLDEIFHYLWELRIAP